MYKELLKIFNQHSGDVVMYTINKETKQKLDDLFTTYACFLDNSTIIPSKVRKPKPPSTLKKPNCDIVRETTSLLNKLSFSNRDGILLKLSRYIKEDKDKALTCIIPNIALSCYMYMDIIVGFLKSMDVNVVPYIVDFINAVTRDMCEFEDQDIESSSYDSFCIYNKNKSHLVKKLKMCILCEKTFTESSDITDRVGVLRAIVHQAIVGGHKSMLCDTAIELAISSNIIDKVTLSQLIDEKQIITCNRIRLLLMSD